ncbi:GLUTAMINE DUMPER 2 protein [Nymphaea thermarum]|nr:GLUTAMINE DUMPER 2 protein [Nymphaea thermarum]
MRPVSSSAGGLTAWHSPIPYLYGGFFVLLFFIAFALIMLACSHRKESRERTQDDPPVTPPAAVAEPKIVVIMSGDAAPSEMRPVSSSPSSSPAGGLTAWHSPIPYLFAGFALLLCLIAVALTVLACSHRKDSSRDTADGPPAEPMSVKIDLEPKIVVIMPGNLAPTFIAKPNAVC